MAQQNKMSAAVLAAYTEAKSIIARKKTHGKQLSEL